MMTELEILVDKVYQHATTAKEVTARLTGTSISRIDSSDGKPLAKVVEALHDCGNSIQKALDWYYQQVEQAANDEEQDFVTAAATVAASADALSPRNVQEVALDEIPSPTAGNSNSTRRPPRLVRANAGVYDETDDAQNSPTSRQSVEVDPYPSRVALETVNHLMFVIHGIGEHADFKDGHWNNDEPQNQRQGHSGKSRLLRDLFRTMRETYLSEEIPLALDIQSVEWHEQVHATGVDAIFDDVSPDGSQKLRQFNKHAFMDLLYYASPTFGQLVVSHVTAQLNAKYQRFLAQHPGWSGHVSIFAHSLGSVIAYDILTHERDQVSANGISFPGLDFPVEFFFAAGSPVPIMALSRGHVGHNISSSSSFLKGFPRPQCAHYFNFIQPSDPISYRVEPLLMENAPSPAALPLVDMYPKQSFAEMIAMIDHLSTRVDLYTKRQGREGTMLELAYAPLSHKSYWSSPELVLFVLAQLCHPVTDILQRYTAAEKPLPSLLPRRFVRFTPHKKMTLATKALVRDPSTATWHAQTVLLGSKHLYNVAAIRDLACTKQWSIPITPQTIVAATDETSFKVTTDGASAILSASTEILRDEWINAIQQRIAAKTKGGNGGVCVDGLELPPGRSIDYFGAVKTSMLTYGWSKPKWVVLTKTQLTCFDACPVVERWWQFAVTTVFVQQAHFQFRFVSPDGTAFMFRLSDLATFNKWMVAIQDSKHCNMTIEDHA
ncbi:hypothetical protein AC1031_000097 [Aphanomyces cochlioides]|nr:hypothetical protein AC1031_000097 [Aphanomyces cochlioides]